MHTPHHLVRHLLDWSFTSDYPDLEELHGLLWHLHQDHHQEGSLRHLSSLLRSYSMPNDPSLILVILKISSKGLTFDQMILGLVLFLNLKIVCLIFRPIICFWDSLPRHHHYLFEFWELTERVVYQGWVSSWSLCNRCMKDHISLTSIDRREHMQPLMWLSIKVSRS